MKALKFKPKLEDGGSFFSSALSRYFGLQGLNRLLDFCFEEKLLVNSGISHNFYISILSLSCIVLLKNGSQLARTHFPLYFFRLFVLQGIREFTSLKSDETLMPGIKLFPELCMLQHTRSPLGQQEVVQWLEDGKESAIANPSAEVGQIPCICGIPCLFEQI